MQRFTIAVQLKGQNQQYCTIIIIITATTITTTTESWRKIQQKNILFGGDGGGGGVYVAALGQARHSLDIRCGRFYCYHCCCCYTNSLFACSFDCLLRCSECCREYQKKISCDRRPNCTSC
uniref:Uncharacterized protein n=1 Tax=Ceratitis capitata TaxID=7213 RepID=W8BEB6_CERCA